MATIHAPTSPVARCSTCGVQRQFHTASDVPHSADRDHEFVAETIADFEPGELTPEQLVTEFFAADDRYRKLTNGTPTDEDWNAAYPHDLRAQTCRDELRARVRVVLGVSWIDLTDALS